MAEIRKDQFYNLTIKNANGSGESFDLPVNAKYERLDVFEGIGMMLLKAYDDDRGFLLTFVDEDEGQQLHEETGIPIIERPFIYASEYNLYITTVADQLNEAMFGLDFDEQAIIEDENGNN